MGIVAIIAAIVWVAAIIVGNSGERSARKVEKIDQPIDERWRLIRLGLSKMHEYNMTHDDWRFDIREFVPELDHTTSDWTISMVQALRYEGCYHKYQQAKLDRLRNTPQGVYT